MLTIVAVFNVYDFCNNEILLRVSFPCINLKYLKFQYPTQKWAMRVSQVCVEIFNSKI